MNKEEWLTFCSELHETYQDTPFAKMEKKMGLPHPTVACRHLKNKKVFAYISERENAVNLALKFDPETIDEARDGFEAITAAYHLNKAHWNDVKAGLDVDDAHIKQMIQKSYTLTLK